MYPTAPKATTTTITKNSIEDHSKPSSISPPTSTLDKLRSLFPSSDSSITFPESAEAHIE